MKRMIKRQFDLFLSLFTPKGCVLMATSFPIGFMGYENFKLRVTDVNIGTGVKTGCAFQSLGSRYPRAFIHKNSLNRVATPTERIRGFVPTPISMTARQS